MRDALDTYHRCILYSNVSRAVRVCVAAVDAGLDLTGAIVRIGGEPITPAKVQAMERAGVTVIPAYGAVESGAIGLGCARPTETDDVHFFSDSFAMITFPYHIEAAGKTVSAFNLTTLLDTSSKIMLNYQSDDYGIMEERACGCKLQAYGYTTHLHHIRSYSKLVGEGVTLIGNEMLQILEYVLPERFGGSPLDYQLMEQEDEKGLTRLFLLISPRVKIPNEQAVVETVFAALSKSSPMADAARNVWQQAKSLQVKRMEPIWTSRGKLLPLHMDRGHGIGDGNTT
jgi:hypothetical protein